MVALQLSSCWPRSARPLDVNLVAWAGRPVSCSSSSGTCWARSGAISCSGSARRGRCRATSPGTRPTGSSAACSCSSGSPLLISGAGRRRGVARGDDRRDRRRPRRRPSSTRTGSGRPIRTSSRSASGRERLDPEVLLAPRPARPHRDRPRRLGALGPDPTGPPGPRREPADVGPDHPARLDDRADPLPLSCGSPGGRRREPERRRCWPDGPAARGTGGARRRQRPGAGSRVAPSRRRRFHAQARRSPVRRRRRRRRRATARRLAGGAPAGTARDRLPRADEALPRRRPGPRPARSRGPGRVGVRAARPERGGQDDHAPAPRRARPRRPPARPPSPGSRSEAPEPHRPDRVPRPGPALLRLVDRPRAASRSSVGSTACTGRHSPRGSTRCSIGSGWPTRPTAGSARTRAGCASGSGSPRPSSPGRRCSSSTSRSARSTPRAGATSLRSSPSCAARRPSSSRPMSSPTWSGSATGSRSSTTVGS